MVDRKSKLTSNSCNSRFHNYDWPKLSLSSLLSFRYLREVCASLLDRKGCVSLQWERTREEGQERRGWEVAYKVLNLGGCIQGIKPGRLHTRY